MYSSTFVWLLSCVKPFLLQRWLKLQVLVMTNIKTNRLYILYSKPFLLKLL